MPVFFEGTLKIGLKKSFENNEGETIEYNEYYFLSGDGEQVLQINSKLDLHDHIDSPGIVELRMQEGRKPSLVSFKKR